MATEFLDSLAPAASCPPDATRLVRRFMKTKGYPRAEPIGAYIEEQLIFFYFRLPEGVLEVETKYEGERWHRRVSDFITDTDEIHEMLGTEQVPQVQPG